MDSNNDYPQYFRPRTNYDWNSTIMVAAIISLSFVVILVIILYIYTRCLLRRQARRQATLRHVTLVTGPSTGPTRHGLDPSVIASLPTFVTKHPSTTSTNNETGPTECSVCLSILEDGELGRLLPNCKHTFHAECVDKWFVSNSTCPVCRAEAEPREGVVVVIESPPSDRSTEGIISDGGGNLPSPKVTASTSRLSSFKRILSRERSSKRMQTQSQEDGLSDVERQ